MSSKRLYVLQRIRSMTLAELASLAGRVLERFDSPELAETLNRYREAGTPCISELTRRRILEYLALRGNLSGRRNLLEMLSEVWPLDRMPSSDHRFETALGDISQHMELNDDWTVPYLFDYLGLRTCSQHRFFQFLSQCVHPLSVEGDEQSAFVRALNEHLRIDGFELRTRDVISGRMVYEVRPRSSGVSGNPKNLIFASDGPKPDLILADAINNDIRIVRNQEHCLIYDRPIADDGLTWRGLVEWWGESEYGDREGKDERALFKRLLASLASEPEKRLFSRYFKRWHGVLAAQLPALVPQVYLHFDPLTLKARVNGLELARQRMDFLMLLSAHERIVIEVDGKQHYAVGNNASPTHYASMVSADRDLRLLGYEVYRFGGYELMAAGWEQQADEFFRRLLIKHGRLKS